MRIPSLPRKRYGMSLVEIIVAVGIAASSITLLIGLLPAGLNTFRQAMNTTVASQIGQRLLYDAAQTDYTVLTNGNVVKPWRYFDGDGTELPEVTGATFHVITRVQPGTSIPTAEAGGVIQPNLATVMVQVILNAENRTIPVMPAPTGPTDLPEGTINPESNFEYATFTGHVAKSL